MKPEAKSKEILNITKAKAKMWEYDILPEYHAEITVPPEKLFPLSIALLGDVAAETNRGNEKTESFKVLKDNLPFAADFFNSFLETRLMETLSPRLRLLASAAFYLCDMPGNAKVLAQSIQYKDLSPETEGLDTLLLWILQDGITTQWQSCDGNFQRYTIDIPPQISTFYATGDSTELEIQTRALRNQAYETGTDEQLLFGDLIAAVVNIKIKNAVIRRLPIYSGIEPELWLPALQNDSFIREFWSAQRLLGETGVFRGKSAVVQMPTSAGKTKSVELILRSAFLARRTNFAIIVAPFRALCNEIKDSLTKAFDGNDIGVDMLSDILQNDITDKLDELLGTQSQPQVLVVTPEKLLYVLRHHPEIANNLKLTIFDEGHQFDTGKRGITYELLLTSLKQFIPQDAQKVLISAVITNAKEIAQWLNGDNTVAQDSELSPTAKSIGFASWSEPLGQIKYVEKYKDIFSVPGVIETKPLRNFGSERGERQFPKNDNGQDIALFLGLKLCEKGSVAIFCGRKDTAVNICKRLLDIVKRGCEIENLTQSSNAEELTALSNLCAENLGAKSIAAQSARMGVLAHHNNMPNGIRIAVEHAMRENKICFLVCTPTLAQGVNLPIRYLIITSLYIGKDLIKVRDFHNLIGRAGRAGKHIEGSVLFAEPNIYDQKTSKENWRWNNAQKLLEARNSKKCDSSLLEIFEPIRNNPQRKQREIISFEGGIESFEGIIESYINNGILELASEISNEFLNDGFDFDHVFTQLFQKRQLIESVENFLLAHWEDIANNQEEQVEQLAKQTLAYHLADEERKNQIVKMFQLLAANIAARVPESPRKIAFGRTLYGIHSSEKIEQWVNENAEKLLEVIEVNAFFEIIWTLFCSVVESNTNKGVFSKFELPDARKDILFAWLAGSSFAELLSTLADGKVRKVYGTQFRKFTVEDIVGLCENTFAFDGMLVVGAIIEFLDSTDGFSPSIKELFQLFQKKLKYGLPTVTAISVYELGFSDRVISQKIAELFQNDNFNKNTVLSQLRSPDIVQAINDFHLPSYYSFVLKQLVQEPLGGAS